MRLLFVCSRNQWRSPTAEVIYRNDPRVKVSSAGISASARRRVTASMLQWANLVLVMDHEHKQRLRESFPDAMREAQVVVLDVPDDYHFMDPELVTMISERVEPLIESMPEI